MHQTWEYRDTSWTSADHDLVGYDVEATDGTIGKVDEATTDASGSYLVVDTGFWIFGKKRLIPAGTITDVDHDGRRITVNLSKANVKDAPDHEPATWGDQSRETHDDYYGPYAGPPSNLP